MCPDGYKFYRGLQADLVVDTTTTGASQAFNIPADAGRVGIVVATNFGAGRLTTNPTQALASVILREFAWQTNTSRNNAWIDEFGPVIMGKLQVIVDTNNVVVRIWNIRVNKDFK